MEKITLRPDYQKVEGLLFPQFPVEHIRETLSYKARPDDIFIDTYPKCGTTWMQNIVLYILRKGRELEKHESFHTYCPFIDYHGTVGIEDMPRPGAFKTHLPFTHVPYSPEAKYIYVLRNPKDCCVSMYYHTVRSHHRVYSEATFDDFFELFMAGEVQYNDYFDHMSSWYPHRYDKNVFFTTYEEMKEDARNVILKVASFLGQDYIEAIEKDNKILNNILRLTGFDYMKERMSEIFTKPGKPKDVYLTTYERKDESPKKRTAEFLRKGIVGDWKNHFSTEQSERMNAKFTERTQGTEIYELYKPYMFQ